MEIARSGSILAIAMWFLHGMTSVSAQIVPVGELGTRLYYDYAERQQAMRYEYFPDFHIAPFLVDSSAETKPYALPLWTKQLHTIHPYAYLTEDVRFRESRRSRSFESAHAGVATRLSDRLSAQVAFHLDEELAQDQSYQGKKWRGFAGDMETAVLTYNTPALAILAGRYRSAWGPTRTNLLLSQEAAPLDGISLRYKLGGHLSFSYQLGRLNSLSPDSGSGYSSGESTSVFINRYVALHRIDISLARMCDSDSLSQFYLPGRGAAWNCSISIP